MSDVADTPVALALRGIHKSFGVEAILKGIDLDIRPCEFLALVGPSGCGKSTLLRIIAGLEDADCGAVYCAGEDVTAKRAADRDMAMVFQSYALYPHLTARQNMAVPLVMRRLNALERLPLVRLFSAKTRANLAAITDEVEQAASLLQITPLLDRKPAQMSGGQRQRVALGRALVRHPKAFLMDEPLSNLDASLRVHMRTEIVSLHKRAGVATIYVTHDQEEALGMADRIAVMMNGEILQVASPQEIYNNPNHIKVASFIGSPRINLLQVACDNNGAVLYGKNLVMQSAQASAQATTLGIRPEHLALSDTPDALSFPVKLDRVEFLGADALVYVTSQDDATPLIAKLAPERASAFQAHQTLYARFAQDHALLFDEKGARITLSAASQNAKPKAHEAYHAA